MTPRHVPNWMCSLTPSQCHSRLLKVGLPVPKIEQDFPQPESMLCNKKRRVTKEAFCLFTWMSVRLTY